MYLTVFVKYVYEQISVAPINQITNEILETGI